MESPSTRKLQRAHFAFMRALLQGLDARDSWNRYLRLEGEPTDLRTIRQTVAWIRDEFAAAAHREARPGTARLVRLDPERFAAGRSFPTLEAFALERGLEDFSEAEQAEAYADAYPEATGGSGKSSARPSQRARVIARQLDALRWLESNVAQDPRPADSVATWLNPAVAARLQSSGLHTLADVARAINETGAYWWRRVPGVGPLKAERIVTWIRARESVINVRIHPQATVPRSRLSPAVLQQVVPVGSTMAPLEKFRPPVALDGSQGRFRAAPDRCRLHATDDRAAIHAWIAEKGRAALPLHQKSPVLSATQRAYRKEAERLLLWSVLVRGMPLSSLAKEDAAAYRAFLENPPSSWCGQRHHQRWSPAWRPLEGPLSASAGRHAVTVLRGLFSYLVTQGYVIANPFAGEPASSPPARLLGSHRALTVSQWRSLDERLDRLPDTEPARRLRRALRWLYATGMRRAELLAARCGDLKRVEGPGEQGGPAEDWQIRIGGKDGRFRHVPVQLEVVAELRAELERQGRGGDLSDPENRNLPLLACFGSSGDAPRPWSASGMAKAIKSEFLRMAREDHQPGMRKASAHWLRHAHALLALQGDAGQSPARLRVVQRRMGHASPGTTSAYLRSGVAPGPPGTPHSRPNEHAEQCTGNAVAAIRVTSR